MNWLDKVLLTAGALLLAALGFAAEETLPAAYADVPALVAFGGFAFFAWRAFLHLRPVGESFARRTPPFGRVASGVALAALAIGAQSVVGHLPLLGALVLGAFLLLAGILTVSTFVGLAAGATAPWPLSRHPALGFVIPLLAAGGAWLAWSASADLPAGMPTNVQPILLGLAIGLAAGVVVGAIGGGVAAQRWSGRQRFPDIAAASVLSLGAAGAYVGYLTTLPAALAAGHVPLVPIAIVIAGLLSILVARADARRGYPLDRDAAEDLFLAFAFGAVLLALLPGGPAAALEWAPPMALAAATGVGVLLALPSFAALRGGLGRRGGPPAVGVAFLVVLAASAELFGPTGVVTLLMALGAAGYFALRWILAFRPIAWVVDKGGPVVRGLVRLVLLATLAYPFLMASRLWLPEDHPIVPITQQMANLLLPIQAIAALAFPALFLLGGILSMQAIDSLAARAKAPRRSDWKGAAVAWGLVALTFAAAVAASLAAATFTGTGHPLAAGLGLAYFALLGAAAIGFGFALVASFGAGRPQAASRVLYLLVLAAFAGWYAGYALAAFGTYESIPIVTAILVAWGALATLSTLPERIEAGAVLRPGAAWDVVFGLGFVLLLAVGLQSSEYGLGPASLLDSSGAWETAGLVLGFLIAPLWRAWEAVVAWKRGRTAPEALAVQA